MKKIIILICCSFILSCDVSNPVLEETLVVMQSYLIAGSNFGGVKLTRVVAPSETGGGFGRLDLPVSNADVVIDDGVNSYTLIEDTSVIPNRFPIITNHGNYYLSPQDTLIIQSNRTYEIRATVEGKVVSAKTTTPSPITVTLLNPGNVKYPSEEARLLVTDDTTISGYLIVTELEFDAPPNFSFAGYNDFYTANSEFVVPWQHLITLGSKWVFVYAFDKNYYEYVKNRKLGNPTQNLHDTKNVIENGLGIVASASLDSVLVNIQ